MGPLDGVNVLDLSRVLAGPYVGQLLGDYGADVIKVEQPGSGDGTRQWGPPWVGSESAYFFSANRNKRSLTLDLKRQEARDIVHQLLEKSDILIENFKVGGMAKLGLDYDTLSESYPGLIYVSITGYGQTGPDRNKPGYDAMIQATGGLMSITGPADGVPHKVGVAIVDVATGLYATTAVLAALHHRQKTGDGQLIDLALLDAQLGALVNVSQNALITREAPGRYGNAHPSLVPYETFETADGHLVLAIGSDAQFERFCHAADRSALWLDPRYRTNNGRVTHRGELIPLLQALLKTNTTAAWLALCEANLIPAGPIQTVDDAFQMAQVQAREMAQTVTHTTEGAIDLIGPVPKFSKTPAEIKLPPPILGEHTEPILAELGYSIDQIVQLRESGVI